MSHNVKAWYLVKHVFDMVVEESYNTNCNILSDENGIMEKGVGNDLACYQSKFNSP